MPKLIKEIATSTGLLLVWYLFLYFSSQLDPVYQVTLRMVAFVILLIFIMTFLPIRLYLRNIGFFLIVPTLTFLGFLEAVTTLSTIEPWKEGEIGASLLLSMFLCFIGPLLILELYPKICRDEYSEVSKIVLIDAVALTGVLIAPLVIEPFIHPFWHPWLETTFFYSVALRQIPYLIGVIWFLVLIDLIIRMRKKESPDIRKEITYGGFSILIASVFMLLFSVRVMFSLEIEMGVYWILIFANGGIGLISAAIYFILLGKGKY